MLPDSGVIVIIIITFMAAMINGALGHGFSTMTVPVALLYHTNRVINPAIVLVEVVVNSYVLLINRASIPHIWRRVIPIIGGLVPGILIGSYLLSSTNPEIVKVLTYAILLPLILLQAAGCRRPIRSERLVGVPFGTGVGIAYSMTTISGPPLACMFNNQGYAPRDFRAAMGLIRVVESTLTAIVYSFLGLYSVESKQFLYLIIPSVIIGIPLGTLLIRHLNPETFRRVCISFDVWIVGFGLSRTLIHVGLLVSPMAYSILLGTILIDSSLLYRYFTVLRATSGPNLQTGQNGGPGLHLVTEKPELKGEHNGSSTARERRTDLVGTGGQTPE